MTVSIEGTTPGIAVDGTGAVVNVTVTTGDGGGGGGVTDHGLLTGLSDDDHTQYAKKASNLSDLASAATARTNLGLGTAAVAATGDFDAAGTAAGLVDDLSGVSNQATARTNLGLGSAATAATGDFATAAQGVDARTPTAHKTSHATGGTDALTASDIGAAATSHTHDVVSNVATARILGRTTSGSGDSEELTAAQTRTLLGVGISGTEPRISPTIGGSKYPIFPNGARGGTDANQSANTIRALTFPMSVYWNLDEVWVQVTTFASGKNLRVGLWSLNSSWTTTLVWDSGNVSAGTNGLKKITASQTNLPPGAYMLGTLCEATTGFRYHYSAMTTFFASTSSIPTYGASIPIIDISHTYGTLPTSPTIAVSGSGETYTPAVMVTSEA